MKRRIGVCAMVFVALTLSLAACGDSDAPSKKPAPSRTSKPTPSASDVITPHELMLGLKAKYNVGYSSLACSSGVAYDDVSCGEELVAVDKVGQALKKAVKARDVKASNAKKLTETADLLHRSVKTIRHLGCFGLGSGSPKSSREAMEGLCPKLGALAMVTYLSLETEADER